MGQVFSLMSRSKSKGRKIDVSFRIKSDYAYDHCPRDSKLRGLIIRSGGTEGDKNLVSGSITSEN